MTTFTLDNFHNHIARDWFNDIPVVNGMRHIGRRTILGLQRAHARVHGVAGAWYADDRFVLIYRDFDGKLRQKTWAKARPVIA